MTDLSVRALYERENAVPPHQRAGAEWVTNKTIYDQLVDFYKAPLPDPDERDLSYAAHLLGYSIRVEDDAEDIALKPRDQLRVWADGYTECTDRTCPEHRYGPHAHRA